MQKEILAQYSDMQQEEKNLKRRIDALERRLVQMEEHGYVENDSVSCGKKGKKPLRTVKIEGFPEPEHAHKQALLRTYKLQLELLDGKLLAALNDVEMYIGGIDDSRMRRLLRHRFVDNMSWTQVAHQMGKHATADSCRMECERFLKK